MRFRFTMALYEYTVFCHPGQSLYMICGYEASQRQRTAHGEVLTVLDRSRLGSRMVIVLHLAPDEWTREKGDG